MGGINTKLAHMYGVVKPGVALPIIIQTKDKPDQATQTQAQQAGAGSITFVGTHTFGTTATEDAASRIAGLPSVVMIYPDEPTYALR